MASKKKIRKIVEAEQALAFLKGGTGFFGGLAPISQTGGRAQVIDTGTAKHRPPMKYAPLMGGKKLVMTGKEKGKII